MKRAIVTGSTKGIGRAIAEELMGHGVFVYLSYSNDDETANKVYNEFEKTFRGLFDIRKVDFSQWGEAYKYLESIVNIVGTIDYIVFNAGGYIKKRIWKY